MRGKKEREGLGREFYGSGLKAVWHVTSAHIIVM
jgi:hypothetical protein